MADLLGLLKKKGGRKRKKGAGVFVGFNFLIKRERGEQAQWRGCELPVPPGSGLLAGALDKEIHLLVDAWSVVVGHGGQQQRPTHGACVRVLTPSAPPPQGSNLQAGQNERIWGSPELKSVHRFDQQLLHRSRYNDTTTRDLPDNCVPVLIKAGAHNPEEVDAGLDHPYIIIIIS